MDVRAPEESIFLSVVTIGELRKGIVLLPAGKRRAELERWFDDYLIPMFSDRILSVNRAIADRLGALDAGCQLRGIALHTADGLIAATAIEHGLALVTRNIKDFATLGVTLLNPWDIP